MPWLRPATSPCDRRRPRGCRSEGADNRVRRIGLLEVGDLVGGELGRERSHGIVVRERKLTSEAYDSRLISKLPDK